MKLEQLIRGIAIEDRRGYFETDIRAITSDSRRVREGDLFVAVRGASSDGHDYIDQALERGALAVLAERWPEEIDQKLPVRPNVILVRNARRALALTAANLHGNPSRDLIVAGVTGTNGKTTVTHILEAIAGAAGKHTGLIGTVGARFAGRQVPATHTTPDALELQALLARMKREAITHVVMEVSSHALDQQRVAGVHFKVAGFTNFSRDHLDYHESLEAYFEAKASLFTRVLPESEARGRMAVINIDDPKGPELVERWGGKTLTTSLEGDESADLHVVDAEYGLEGTTALIRTRKGEWQIATHLVGPHNLANVLTAVGMAQAMGFSKGRIDAGLAALTGVPGRFEAVPNEEGKRVFIDYAHTPGALEHMIRTARPLTPGRIIVVFGCGGDRDRAKRPIMGRIVAEGADAAVLTSDNPRNEDPGTIAEAVEAGLREGGWSPGEDGETGTYVVELDRRAAIRRAIGWMRTADVVIIAGKGHERVQIVKGESLPFDDREEARRIIAGLPPPPPPPATTEGPVTQRIESSAVVESIDIEPDIVEETDDEGAREGSE
jgi:UDP-N-acetylmuramoyl-L-alanyl-D-glutamate--2,6-diaminopimelate ligase